MKKVTFEVEMIGGIVTVNPSDKVAEDVVEYMERVNLLNLYKGKAKIDDTFEHQVTMHTMRVKEQETKIKKHLQD